MLRRNARGQSPTVTARHLCASSSVRTACYPMRCNPALTAMSLSGGCRRSREKLPSGRSSLETPPRQRAPCPRRKLTSPSAWTRRGTAPNPGSQRSVAPKQIPGSSSQIPKETNHNEGVQEVTMLHTSVRTTLLTKMLLGGRSPAPRHRSRCEQTSCKRAQTLSERRRAPTASFRCSRSQRPPWMSQTQRSLAKTRRLPRMRSPAPKARNLDDQSLRD
mmetsp:Transcript_117013/g.250030  ORF Transcript_117013/g.250030 Transcript_117013/m.250030 type:complete len:218 (+) Transcript_117013:1300-1953(+)